MRVSPAEVVGCSAGFPRPRVPPVPTECRTDPQRYHDSLRATSMVAGPTLLRVLLSCCVTEKGEGEKEMIRNGHMALGRGQQSLAFKLERATPD